jgi:hypothetical protein
MKKLGSGMGGGFTFMAVIRLQAAYDQRAVPFHHL